MATFVVGDVQGCYDPLRRLLDAVQFDPAVDTLWAVGDLINRGPHSLQVVRFVRALGESFRAVLGNHDLHYLAVASGARAARRKDTLDELLASSDGEEHFEWFRRLPLAHYEHGVLMVHAGVPPSWTLDDVLARAREVETWLQGPNLRDFLTHTYKDGPRRFEPDSSPLDRARSISNALTRMRFCTEREELDLKNKQGPETAAPGTKPWFEYSGRALKDTPIVFGHWATLEGRTTVPNVYGLDTGCVWGLSLTALCLDDWRRYSCHCRGDGASVEQ